ncbi:MAG TPA: hypothetical protein DCG06_10435 [Deltaproteobacteria bacterium]|nr:hypothetical protein [Deltaproteobacteria bacterium]
MTTLKIDQELVVKVLTAISDKERKMISNPINNGPSITARTLQAIAGAILGHPQTTGLQTAAVAPDGHTATALTHYGRRRRRRMRR